MKKEQTKETLMFSNLGTVAQSIAENGECRHYEKEFEVVTDYFNSVGYRIITLKPKDRSEFYKQKKAVINAILKNLNESTSKVMRKILDDMFIDYTDLGMNNLYKTIVLNKTPVKAKKGCFKLIVGDGRKKNSIELMIRD